MERFWSKVRKTAQCWLWLAGADGSGTPAFKVGRKQVVARRFAFEEENGPIPEGLWLKFVCGEIRCVRPSHMLLTPKGTWTPETPADLFRAKVKKGKGCWIWQGNIDQNGYGRFYPPGNLYGVRAHRFAYELEHGELDKEIDVLHTCDNPPCVKPKHLFTGTHADNNADRDRKGRIGRGTNGRYTKARQRI